MGQSKLYKIQKYLVFLFLAFFSFGQLPKLISQLWGINLSLLPADMIALLLGLSFVLYKSKSEIYQANKPIFFFISAAIFSWLVSLGILGPNSLFGLLYLIRLISYLCIFIVVKQLIKDKILSAKQLLKALLIVGIIICLLGIAQYLLLPDLRNLHLFGWDDHYYRLASTFLDPAYAGIIIVLSAIGVVCSTLFNKSSKFMLLGIFVVALGLTYSRASYLSMIVAGIFLLTKNKIAKYTLGGLIAIIILLIIIPSVGGEGVNLFRTSSIFLRLGNYQQSLEIAAAQPLFGVGYNNICLAKQVTFGVPIGGLNACSGLDNSFLFLLATTGLVGFLAFIYLVYTFWLDSNVLFKTSLIAIGVHALFSNTLVYPFVLFWMAVLFAVKENRNI